MNNLLNNWKTTSAGLAMIISSAVHLIVSVSKGAADETTWTTGLMGIVGGIGLIFAGDGSKSAEAHEETKALVAGLQNQISQVKQDTATIAKNP